MIRRACLLAVFGLAACSSRPPSPCKGLPALAIDQITDLGAFSLPSIYVEGRDGVNSGLFHGQILWTFGDTFLGVGRNNPADGSSVISATSGWSFGVDPLALDEPVDANGVPAQLIPFTTAEIWSNEAGNGWALWPGPLVEDGGSSALVYFSRVERSDGDGSFATVGIGTARLAPGAAVAERDAADLFTALPGGLSAMGSGGISLVDGTVYMLACDPTGVLEFACRMARAPVEQAGASAAFTFFDGSRWSAYPGDAVPVLGGVSVASLSFNPHLGKYLSVGQEIISNTAVLRTAAAPQGPWTDSCAEISSGDGILPPTMGGSTNYLTLEHVELRSTDGRQIVVSYSRPLAPFRGEVRLARIIFH